MISIDFGGVIAEKIRNGGPESVSQMPEVPGALAAIQRLLGNFGRDRVWIVSRASDEARPRILDWLERHGIIGPESDTVPRDHVRFCYERAEKAAILAEIGASAHVDDRPEVFLAPGAPANMLKFLFRPSLAVASDPRLSNLRNLFFATDWRDLLYQLEHEL